MPELPGLNGQWIQGATFLPRSEHADLSNEVEVFCKGEFYDLHYTCVDKDYLWRPISEFDSRPFF
jgi:hypothetical protein